MNIGGLKIMYVSNHAVLEYDEVSLFLEMGANVFANGAYLDPRGSIHLPRPALSASAGYYPEYVRMATEHPRTEMPMELINVFDLIIVMHSPTIIDTNWKRLSKKRVIWRSIGQSNREIERIMGPYKGQGLKIVRYSPKESLIPSYAGQDAMIRFYKDPEEWKDWNGNTNQVVNMTQSLLGRRTFCHYDHIMEIMKDFDSKVYGSGNEDLGTLNGGEVNYHRLKEVLRDSRVYVYGGTWPAAYTLSFAEAWLTGIPVVAIGKHLAENMPGIAPEDKLDFYEIADFIQNGENGYISNSLQELHGYVELLLHDYSLAKKIGDAGRGTALYHFGKEKIKQQWAEFFEQL